MRTLTTAKFILLLSLAIGCGDSPTEPTRNALSIGVISEIIAESTGVARIHLRR
jgi:hypothetical protein